MKHIVFCLILAGLLSACTVPAGARVGPAIYTDANGQTVEQGLSVVSVKSPPVPGDDPTAKAAKDIADKIERKADEAARKMDDKFSQITRVGEWVAVIALALGLVLFLRRKS